MAGIRRTAAAVMILVLLPVMPLLAQMDLNMMMGNDNITFGLAENNDDGISFGAKIDLGIGNHTVNMSMSGVTVKGYRTDMGPVRGRYDSFNIGYSYLFSWKFDRSHITLQPYAGFDLVGNMGMEWVQNTYHGIIKKEKVYLPYDIQEIRFLPTVGFELSWLYGLNGNIDLGIQNRFSYRIHFGIRNDIMFSMMYQDHLRISLGYCAEKNLTGENNSYEVQTRKNSGFTLSSTIHAGIFAVEFTTNLTNRLSYGLIGFNPLAFMDMRSFDDTGRTVIIGAEFGYPGYMHRLVLDYHDWQIRIKYVGGEIETGSEKRRNNASFALGYDFIWDLGHFSPFVTPWGGIAQYIYYMPNWSTNEPDILVRAFRPVVGVDVGVRMIKKGTIKLGGSSCAVNLGASLSWNIATGNITNSEYPEYIDRISPFEARGFIELVFYM